MKQKTPALSQFKSKQYIISNDSNKWTFFAPHHSTKQIGNEQLLLQTMLSQKQKQRVSSCDEKTLLLDDKRKVPPNQLQRKDRGIRLGRQVCFYVLVVMGVPADVVRG